MNSLKAFLLSGLLILPFTARAQTSAELERMIEKACAEYDGSTTSSHHIDPVSGEFINPLLGTDLGAMVYRETFGSAYRDYDYSSTNTGSRLATRIIAHPKLEQILEGCYGRNEDAKRNFIFFLRYLETETKTNAGFLKLAATGISVWAGGGLFRAGMAKVATHFAKRAASLRLTLKWTDRFAKAIMIYVGARGALSIYRSSKHEEVKATGKIIEAEVAASKIVTATGRELDAADARHVAGLQSTIAEFEILRRSATSPKEIKFIETWIENSRATIQEFEAQKRQRQGQIP